MSAHTSWELINTQLWHIFQKKKKIVNDSLAYMHKLLSLCVLFGYMCTT